MTARIILTATGGPCQGRVFVFSSRAVCTVGRSEDCQLPVRGDADDLTVSRRHCLLEIDPPAVRVHDLRSLNGTFVNGRRIGRSEKGTPTIPADPEGVELHDGDRLKLGRSEFVVGVQHGSEDRAPAGMSLDGQAAAPAAVAECR
jgi:pSer/pThr/pTyr-binding forkhead associated (FHA) protein